MQLLTKWNHCSAKHDGRHRLSRGLHTVLFMVLAAVLTAPLLAGCNQPAASDEGPVAVESVPVTVQNPTSVNMRNLIRFTGDVRPDTEVHVNPKVPERITNLRHEVGDWVEAGAILAEVVSETVGLGVAQTLASLEAAQVNLRSADDDFARIKALYAERVASKAQYDGAKTRLDAAAAQVRSLEAALGQSKSTLRDTLITAPVSGVITARYVDEGNMASPASPIYTIMAIDQVRIKVPVTESEFAKVARGMEVEIRVPAYGSKLFEGFIERTSPIIDLQTRMGTMEILIPNEEHLLRPGMFATVSVVAEIREGVLSIPQEALIYDDELVSLNGTSTNYRVYLAGSNSQAILQPVLVGIRERGRVQILAGVDEGSRVIVRGWQFLRDGVPIRVLGSGGGGARAGGAGALGDGSAVGAGTSVLLAENIASGAVGQGQEAVR